MSTEREIEIPDAGARHVSHVPALAAHPGASLERDLDTPAHIYYKYEGASPAGSHKPNTAIAAGLLQQGGGRQRADHRDRRRAVGERAGVRLRSSAWSAGSSWCKVSYDQKPYRAVDDADLGRDRRPSPSDGDEGRAGDAGRGSRFAGSLGIAISEAVEDAATREDTKYSLGSVLNHVLMHQTVIGQEAMKQMEMAGE